jgi:adenine-specific DNA-methyltransferase
MPTTEHLRNKLLKKLSELFQLDQPDLDFGFYRIMHAKAKEVQDFLSNDLLKIISDAFGDADDTMMAELKEAYKQAIYTAKEFGAPNPEETEPVKKAKAALEAVKDTAGSEADVYDHLYRFFERYYEDGDFISRRYYTRETSGKASPYAIPYNGEEVKLHWANADQYYIKSSEYLSNYTFDLVQSSEVRNMSSEERLLFHIPEKPVKAHFRIIDATEGEHGNVKASDANKRFFIIYADDPVTLNENDELVIHFEYRADPEKSGQDGTWRDKRNTEAVETILSRLEKMVHTDDEKSKLFDEYLQLLKILAPSENDKSRPILAKYINQFTARNTMDYFIHKDLGGFLRRELDFYIKNEVMCLDDIEHTDAPAVESYLSKIKVMRTIAGKLIDFLSQLENFQKKLWFKKKFVVETNYCITLDRVPEDLYPEIIENDAQIDEWIKLFAIDEIESDLHNPGFSRPLTLEFLKSNDKLILDTHFFDETFKDQVIASIDNIDDQCNGLLIHSENYQALNLISSKFNNSVNGIYIDPPYNTDASSIIYKNNYKDSSWLSLMDSRLRIAKNLLVDTGIICVAIDDEEVIGLRNVLDNIFPKPVGIATVRSNPAGRKTKGKFAPAHEYALFYGNSWKSTPCSLDKTEKSLARYPKMDEIGRFAWANFIRSGNNDKREDRPKLYYPIAVNSNDNIRILKMKWDEKKNEWLLLEEPKKDEILVYPVVSKDGKSIEKNWQRGSKRVPNELHEYRVRRTNTKSISIDFKTRMDEESLPITWWEKKEYASANYGASEQKELFGEKLFDFPKATTLVVDCIKAIGLKKKNTSIVDFFGGSGTTGHAVIKLNRKDNGDRKYIIVEMGNHFDNVLKPRTSKVIYSPEWKDGKPVSIQSGISHCYKYIRLESYEDALNNLQLKGKQIPKTGTSDNHDLNEDFMLNYMLDVETKGSQSLLNIDAFADPTAYTLQVKKPGTDENAHKTVDLLETFNYLIGLSIQHIDVSQTFNATFKRINDPELPDDQNTKLIVDGDVKQDPAGPWWFRSVTGLVPKNPTEPNNGQRDNVLIIWRKLTGDIEQDNLMLDEWFKQYRKTIEDFNFNIIFVNCSNNLANQKTDNDLWDVRLLEEEFMNRMWDIDIG